MTKKAKNESKALNPNPYIINAPINTKAMVKYFDDKFVSDYRVSRVITATDFASYLYGPEAIPPQQRNQNDVITSSEGVTYWLTGFEDVFNAFQQKKTKKLEPVNMGSVKIVYYIPNDVKKGINELVRIMKSTNIMDGVHRAILIAFFLANKELFYSTRILTDAEGKKSFMKGVIQKYGGMTIKEVEEDYFKRGLTDTTLYDEFMRQVLNADFIYTHDVARIGETLIMANSGRPVSEAERMHSLAGAYEYGKAVWELMEKFGRGKRKIAEFNYAGMSLSTNEILDLKAAYHFLSNTGKTQHIGIARYISRTYEIEQLYKAVQANDEDAWKDTGHVAKNNANFYLKQYEAMGDDFSYFEKTLEMLKIAMPITSLFKNRNVLKNDKKKTLEGLKTYDNMMLTIMYGIYFIAGCDMAKFKSMVNHVKNLIENEPKFINEMMEKIMFCEIEDNLRNRMHAQNGNNKDDDALVKNSHFSEKRDRYLKAALPYIREILNKPYVVNGFSI